MPEQNNVDNVEFLELGEPTPQGGEPSPQQPSEQPDKDEDKKDEQVDKNEKDKNEPVQKGDGQDSDQIENDTETPDVNDEGDEAGDEPSDEGDEKDQPSLFESVLQQSNVQFEDEEYEELLNTPETEEGLNKVTSRIAEKKAEEHFSSLMEQYPHTSRMLEYEMHGGDPEKYYDAYFPEQDYENMEIQEDDVETQKQVVAKSLREQGLDQEDIESEIKDLEDAGLLNRRAKRSLKVLRKQQEKKREEVEQEREQLKKERQKEAKQRYENTVEIVENGNIEGVQVPQNKKDEFISYLFEPVNEQGHTQAQLDSQELGLEQRLLMAYLNFSDYNLDGFIKNQAKNAGNSSLRQKLKKSEDKENLKDKGNRGSEKPGNPEDIVSPFV